MHMLALHACMVTYCAAYIIVYSLDEKYMWLSKVGAYVLNFMWCLYTSDYFEFSFHMVLIKHFEPLLFEQVVQFVCTMHHSTPFEDLFLN